jgi:hypothetical protein
LPPIRSCGRRDDSLDGLRIPDGDRSLDCDIERDDERRLLRLLPRSDDDCRAM